MQLTSLKIAHFKNYSQTQLQLKERIICITGLNGAGKTNLLDAVHYLSSGKSALNTIDSQNIQHGQDYFTLEGNFELNQSNNQVFCGFMKGQKKRLKLDGKDYERLVMHYGKFPCVMISPPDIALVTEGHDERRKFVDSTISVYNDFYLDCLLQYNQIMTQRNAHLKQYLETRKINEKLIDVYDKQLNYFGSEIHKERQAFEEDFAQVFTKIVKRINNENEQLTLKYNSQMNEKGLLHLLTACREKDKATGRTDAGPHKDQWVFEIDGMPLKKFGSQGQQKSHLLALKLAKADIIASKTKKDPILLLDDIFDRLDDDRVKNLIEVINSSFGQVLITDTSRERLEKILKLCQLQAQFISVENGAVVS